MPEIELEVLAFWFPLLGQIVVAVPALGGERGNRRLQRALICVAGQIGLLGLLFLGSTLPCLEADCEEYRNSGQFRTLQVGHLLISYTLLAVSLRTLRQLR